MAYENMFNFPENLSQLIEQIVTQGKTVTAQELAALMKQDIDISKILVLLQTNGKAALENCKNDYHNESIRYL